MKRRPYWPHLNPRFKIGDRVYYADNGEEDTGTVNVVHGKYIYVTFDDETEPDWYQGAQLVLI